MTKKEIVKELIRLQKKKDKVLDMYHNEQITGSTCDDNVFPIHADMINLVEKLADEVTEEEK